METWRLKAKAVTKYSSENYSSEGVYKSDEWTSRSDIGKKIDRVANTILTEERYAEVESDYINSAKAFAEEVKAKRFRVTELYKVSDLADFEKNRDMELYDFYNVLAEKEYDIHELDIIMRLVLREYIQVEIKLIASLEAAIYFGYDYYMYFVGDGVDFGKLQDEIYKYNMFVD